MDRRRAGICATAAMFVVTAAGCATPQADESSPPIPDAASPPPSGPAELRSIVDAAVRDAASRLTVDPKVIEVVSAGAVTWSDGSLGCPADGMTYTQALVPGYRVMLRAAGQLLDYHAGANGHVALCPPERAVEPIQDERI